MRDREHQEAVALFHWWTISSNRFGVDSRLFAAIPNGGHRHIGAAKKLKAEGVQAGMPDYFLFVPMGPFKGLAIELKAPITGRLSDSQKGIKRLMLEQGYDFKVCFGWDEPRKAIESYLSLKPEKIETEQKYWPG